MNLIIESTLNTLNKSKSLLSILSNDELADDSVPPYYSCIGSHIRHILDLYDCVLEGIGKRKVDLSNRARNERMHGDCDYALQNLMRIISALNDLKGIDTNLRLQVTDDLGLGSVTIMYTLGAVLAQANSHAIHHYAIINYILDNLGVSIEDETFGYNPTTPRSEAKMN